MAPRNRTDASERYAELRRLAEAVKFAPGNEWFTAADLLTYASQKYGDVILADDAAYIAAANPQALLALLADNTALREALEIIEVDLTAGDMPCKTRVELTLHRVRAALASALPDPNENKQP